MTSCDQAALSGRAVWKEVRLKFSTGQASTSMYLLIFLPAEFAEPVLVFVGLNFRGNHWIHPDPAITSASRGSSAHRWPLERILGRGYGLASRFWAPLPGYRDRPSFPSLCGWWPRSASDTVCRWSAPAGWGRPRTRLR